METAIRWSPLSTTAEQRFLSVDLAGKSFKICRVNAFDGKKVQYKELSSYSKVPAFRAFDWSPIDDSLIAVGQAAGELAILRMTEESQEYLPFPARSQRQCNAVAFSTHGLLASGLDRVRNDFSLNIWDVSHRLSAGRAKSYVSEKNVAEPLRKLALSEPITSIRFFQDQPETLVAGVTGQFVRIYDLRDGSGNPSLQISTRCVHNLAIDWLDENYFASCSTSNDAIVCIWDRRVGARYNTSTSLGVSASGFDSNLNVPSLELKNVFYSKASMWSMRFSRTKKGCLGVLSSTGHFKAYDIVKEYWPDEYRTSIDDTHGKDTKIYPEQIYTKYVRDIHYPFSHTRRGCAETERVVSFDFLNISASNEPSAVVLAANGEVSISALEPPGSPVRLSSQSALVHANIRDGSEFTMINPLPCEESFIADVIYDIRHRALTSSEGALNGKQNTNSAAGRATAHTLSSRISRERNSSLGCFGYRLRPEEALTLLALNRVRCKEGYLFNTEKNKSILTDDSVLQDLWDWIEHARRESSGSSMVSNGLDLNYLGVYDIWNNELGQTLESRRISPQDSHPDVEQTIIDLVHDLALPETRSCETAYPEHRRLCLRLCRALQTPRHLEEVVKDLVADHQHTKAAALAVFQDEPKLAYLALRSHGSTQSHKLLAMAIAGAAKGDTDTDWEETCAEIAEDLTDPYARAILALVSKGDWTSVLQETTLPLQYRVEVALRWLPDDELTTYLKATTAEAIRAGDIEGILLTGLGHSAMNLFQSYIRKFDDVQTPVLAMSLTVPRFINDEKSRSAFEAWRETYRLQMNSWKLQMERARFDVTSRRFAVTWDGRKQISPPPQQVSLTCNYCTRPLTQHDTSSQVSPTATGDTVHHSATNPLGSAAMSGTVCPRCGRHMPRCGVCSLWLGSPDPASKACIAADAGDHRNTPTETDLMRRFVIFCMSCNHGFHADHARAWFAKHRVCPVAECNCNCDR